ncbi:MAG: hypothetical protein M3040_04215 [Bacteroidota bacterium]|nr:hypothetical protein [Bacteroidota bacterium]
MKKIMWTFSIFLLAATLSCSKKSVDAPPPEEVGTKFPPPTWRADATGKYPATMTAVVALPATLVANGTDNDNLAAFADNECRGEGVIVKVNGTNLFFVLIQGQANETSKITFKYYSNKTSYMYESSSPLNFLVDAIYGSAANPKTLEFTQLR